MIIKCRECPNKFEQINHKRFCDNCLKKHLNIKKAVFAKKQPYEVRFIYKIRMCKYNPEKVLNNWLYH